MQRTGRRIFDSSFTAAGAISLILLGLALMIVLAPIVAGGVKAFVFKGTIEYRIMSFERFGCGSEIALEAELNAVRASRQPIYDMLAQFDEELAKGGFLMRRKYEQPLHDLRQELRHLLGPAPDDPRPPLPRNQYGQVRYDKAREAVHHVLNIQSYDYSDPTVMGEKIYTPRIADFEGTSLEGLFEYISDNFEAMMDPRWVFYWRFLLDNPVDSQFFGGIWPAMLGTLYLTLGAMLFAVPMGVLSAVYFVEYSGQGRMVSLLRTFIGTLAGVPSIVFGLFGLAFFINAAKVSESKSVLAGSLTLALLILPMVIRASEEAIRTVPQTFKEAAMSMGASRWRTIINIILPSALPGILTGIVISMGRAAGETAPIMFTAAVSVGRPLALWQTLSQPTPALPWNIYNLATEHEAADEIRHVQYGMVLTLVALVLLLNIVAVILRARIQRKLKG